MNRWLTPYHNINTGTANKLFPSEICTLLHYRVKVITLLGKRSLLHYQAKIITLSVGQFVTLSGDFITLSGGYYINGRFYYLIGKLLH